jgi:hypothetical protein
VSRPNVDTNPVAAARERREALIAAPPACHDTVLAAVTEGVSSRWELARYFDVDDNDFPLRRITRELVGRGLLEVLPDLAGEDDYRIRLAQPKARRKAA